MQNADPHTAPLLQDVEQFGEETAPTKPAASLYRPRLVCYTLLSLLALFVFGTLGYLFQNGAFHKIDDNPAGVVNGTVVEPNSHESFPIQLPKTLLGLPGPERLMGVYLTLASLGHVNMRVTASGLYFDRNEARRQLVAFRKSGLPSPKTSPEEFTKFIQLAGALTFRFELRLLMSTPGTQLQDSWVDLLANEWAKLGASKQEVVENRQCFLSWFASKSGTHKGDKIVIEYCAKTKAMRMERNGKVMPGECKHPVMGTGLLQLELGNRDRLAYLLPLLWDTQYDKY